MRRTSHQHGSLKLADRRKGKVWEFRWREVQIDGSVCRKNIVVGTLEEFPNESAAQSAVDAIRLTINRQTPQQLLKNVSVETLVKHYQEHELPDIFSQAEASDWKLRRASQVLLHAVRLRHLLEKVGSSTLAVIPSFRGESGRCRSVVENNAVGTWEQGQNQESDERLVFSCNSVGVDGTKPDQERTSKCEAHEDAGCPDARGDHGTSQKLPEPLRTAAELDAFTGLRRGELIGLQWEDVDFENLVIHVRRSVVMMVQGAPKTEASAKDVPLDAALAESLLKLRLVGPYNRETDWVFASPTMKGKQPLWPETLWRRYGRPAVKAAKIQKRVGFHTFRHTYTTLLTQNNEEVKVVQELLRHANSRITLDLYAQAGMQEKQACAEQTCRMVLEKERHWPNWTKLDHGGNCRFFASA